MNTSSITIPIKNCNYIVIVRALSALSDMRYLWNTHNHMLAASSNGYVSTYIYDADGQRAVKQSAGSESVYTNGLESGQKCDPMHYSLYVNPYFMMYDDDHVNKHIYIDNERVAVKKFLLSSVLGGYTVENLQSAAGYNIADINYDSIRGVQESIIADSYTEFDLPFPETNRGNNQYFAFIPSSGRFIAPSDTIAEEPTDEERLIPNPVSFTHYYVSDHIGSTRLVSNEQGRIVQSLLYTPTGELLLDRQYIDGYHGDFQFSGKEVDEETGLSYFGARYLDSHKNIWLSPDPLQLKYPHVSSYAYCMGNPVRLIDPNGRDIVVPNVQDRERFAAWINAIASNTYGFDDFGVLYKMHEGKEYTSFPERQRLYSQIYSDYLDKGINNHDATIFMSIGNQIYDDGVMKDIDEHFGGGATALSKNMDVAYTILSGNNYFGSPSKYNEIPEPVWGDRNSFMNSIIHVSPTGKINVVDTPEWILVHELVGHGIPWMTIEQPNLSSAIINYNKVRREVGLSERFEDPNHYKYKIYNQE